MSRRTTGVFLASMLLASCAGAPVGDRNAAQSSEPIDDATETQTGKIDYEDVLSGTSPDRLRKCQKVAETGSYIKRTVCEPLDDDRDMLDIISTTNR